MCSSRVALQLRLGNKKGQSQPAVEFPRFGNRSSILCGIYWHEFQYNLPPPKIARFYHSNLEANRFGGGRMRPSRVSRKTVQGQCLGHRSFPKVSIEPLFLCLTILIASFKKRTKAVPLGQMLVDGGSARCDRCSVEPRI